MTEASINLQFLRSQLDPEYGRYNDYLCYLKITSGAQYLPSLNAAWWAIKLFDRQGTVW